MRSTPNTDSMYAFNAPAMASWILLYQAINISRDSITVQAAMTSLNTLYTFLQTPPHGAQLGPTSTAVYAYFSENFALTGLNGITTFSSILGAGLTPENLTLLINVIVTDPVINGLFTTLHPISACYRDLCNWELAASIHQLYNQLNGDTPDYTSIATDIVAINAPATACTDGFTTALQLYLNTPIIPGATGTDLVTLSKNANYTALQATLAMLGVGGQGSSSIISMISKVYSEEFSSEGYPSPSHKVTSASVPICCNLTIDNPPCCTALDTKTGACPVGVPTTAVCCCSGAIPTCPAAGTSCI